MICARIIEDSVWNGVRITTFQVRAPRFILAEINTHGILAKSSRSTRAVPTAKLRREVLDDPFVPERFYKNGKGMAGKELMVGWEAKAAKLVWRLGRYPAVLQSALLSRLGVHKQHAGRPLEPWMWVDTVLTATEWSNFFNLRVSAGAQPEFDRLARLMRFQLNYCSEPTPRMHHLPYITGAERPSIYTLRVKADTADGHGPSIPADPQDYIEDLFAASARRCASVSYAPHDGSKADVTKDAAAAKKNLLQPGHMSPFDHAALAVDPRHYKANRFAAPWVAFRKSIPYEHDPMSDPTRRPSV